MNKGCLLFAFNSPEYDYYKMAEFTAKRINNFLNLPVTVVTDSESVKQNTGYSFDKTVIVDPITDNVRDQKIWINKGRYRAFELSPYDQTLLLDTDYLVNSGLLLKTFQLNTDFCCHDHTRFLLHENDVQEYLSPYSYKTFWATVINFKKTKRTKHIFECLQMVQENYDHYNNIHGFLGGFYRNDYALTLAVRIADGHLSDKSNIIPWNLVHIGKNTKVHKTNLDFFDTNYAIMFDTWKNNKIKKEYVKVSNFDFHMMNKENFLEIVNA